MKVFLLFLILGGAALYTFLVVTHDALQDGKTENTLAVQTQPNQPVAQQLSSWGSHLSSRSLSQKPEAPSAPALLPPQPSPSHDLEQMPGADHQFAASEDKAATPESDSADREPVVRAKVVLAAQMHSEGSVSAPTVRYYRPGTELQVVGRVDGWFQVSDPVTQDRGWIFEKYLSSIDSPSLTQAAMESTTTEPLPAKPVVQKPKKQMRSAKSAVRVVAQSDPWSGRGAGRADRRRGFGLFMFRHFASAQRTNSPVLFAGPQ
jgi:hypothetical protein